MRGIHVNKKRITLMVVAAVLFGIAWLLAHETAFLLVGIMFAVLAIAIYAREKSRPR
jgi:hypothetical protein